VKNDAIGVLTGLKGAQKYLFVLKKQKNIKHFILFL